MAREYGRAPSGERVQDDKPYNHGENVSLVGALGLGGLRTLMTLGGAVDGVAFVAFVRSFLAPTLQRGDIVLMDNLSVHKVLVNECGIFPPRPPGPVKPTRSASRPERHFPDSFDTIRLAMMRVLSRWLPRCPTCHCARRRAHGAGAQPLAKRRLNRRR